MSTATTQIVIRANDRGHARYGWLESFHTFSFANYYNPQRMHFGALRVINDDWVAPGMGFGKHPHDNMEIISIPLSGALRHQDSMGNETVIRTGEVQVMSAGTGIVHSEINDSNEEAVRFLQIWVIPNRMNVAPRYQQIVLDPAGERGKWLQIVSPNPDDDGIWVHQEAWFHLGSFAAQVAFTYTPKGKDTGCLLFVLEGSVKIGDILLNRRDSILLTNVTSLVGISQSDNARLLIMEVTLNLNR
jgi:redox-sensitive bicupin YhaK (pirin superfamily)